MECTRVAQLRPVDGLRESVTNDQPRFRQGGSEPLNGLQPGSSRVRGRHGKKVPQRFSGMTARRRRHSNRCLPQPSIRNPLQWHAAQDGVAGPAPASRRYFRSLGHLAARRMPELTAPSSQPEIAVSRKLRSYLAPCFHLRIREGRRMEWASFSRLVRTIHNRSEDKAVPNAAKAVKKRATSRVAGNLTSGLRT